MKILVTGSDGQVGTELRIQSVGHDFHLIYTDKAQMDICNLDEIDSVISSTSPDLILNLAAYTNVELAEEEEDLAYLINADAVKNLAEVCKDRSLPLIHISTDYVFSGKKEQDYTEDDQPSPINIYGASKLLGEQYLREILPNHIILRSSWLFSNHSGHNFINAILNKAKSQDHIKVINDIFGCPTSVRSLVECIFSILREYSRTKELQNGTFHFVNSPASSWHIFATHIVDLAFKNKIIKKPVLVEPVSNENYETKASRPSNSSMSCNRIKTAYKIEQVNWRSELTQIMKDYNSEHGST